MLGSSLGLLIVGNSHAGVGLNYCAPNVESLRRDPYCSLNQNGDPYHAEFREISM